MTHKVLIADDEPNIVISLEYLLQREGYRVALAKLGGTPDEPIDLELAYVYVSDEVSAPGRSLGGDPHRRVIEARRVLADALPACAPR